MKARQSLVLCQIPIRMKIFGFTLLLFTGNIVFAQDVTGTFEHNPEHPAISDIEITGIEAADGIRTLEVNWTNAEGTATSMTADRCDDCVRQETAYAPDMNIRGTYKLTFVSGDMNETWYLICVKEEDESTTFMKVEETVEDFSFNTSVYQLLLKN